MGAEATRHLGGSRSKIHDRRGIAGFDRVTRQPNGVRRHDARAENRQGEAMEPRPLLGRERIEDGLTGKLVSEGQESIALLEHAARQTSPRPPGPDTPAIARTAG